MWLRYNTFCKANSIQASQVTYHSLSLFLIDVTNSRGGSTRSLSGTISQLRVSAGPSAWLSYEDQLKIKTLENQLKGLDFSDSNAVSAFQFYMVQEAIKLMDLNVPAQLQIATMLSTGVNSLFRTAETCNGILAEHVIFVDTGPTRSVSIKLLRTKTLLTGPGCIVEVPEFDSPYCCYRLLKSWWKLNSLDQKPGSFIFPTIRNGAIDWSTPMTGDYFRKAIKKAVASIGLNPRRYSGHSLRSGGATDLFEARTPYHIIKKMGRWKSDAAMRYYRSEEDVLRAVRKAFTRMSKKEYKTPF
jgi:hypothetical protein